MLISHYNALCGQARTVTGMVGTVDQECLISRVASLAYTDAANLCDGEYLAHPEIKITALDTTTGSQEVSCVYVPSHLHHIFFEIFKVRIFSSHNKLSFCVLERDEGNIRVF